MGHPEDHDLERYYLGMVHRRRELRELEEHLLWCEECIRRTQKVQNYIVPKQRFLG